MSDSDQNECLPLPLTRRSCSMTLFERVEVAKEVQSRLEVDTYTGRLQLQPRLCRMTEDSRKSEDRARVLHGEVCSDAFQSPYDVQKYKTIQCNSKHWNTIP